MNQSTLKQLPETARQRQLHAFKICKKFQVGDSGVGCVPGGCPAPVIPAAPPALVPSRSRCRISARVPERQSKARPQSPSRRSRLLRSRGLRSPSSSCSAQPQAVTLVTAKPEPAAGQLCAAEPDKPRQRGGPAPRFPLISCPLPAPQPLLFADLLDENCLVMVERPIMDVKTQLPLPIQQKKFGT